MFEEDGEAIIIPAGISFELEAAVRGMISNSLLRQRHPRPGILQHALPAHNPQSQHLPALRARGPDTLHNRLENDGQIAVRPGRERRDARGADDGLAAVLEDGALDGGGVRGVALHDEDLFVKGCGQEGLEFGGRAHVGDDGVVVGEEGGDEARADVACCAEEEDFHFCLFWGWFEAMLV